MALCPGTAGQAAISTRAHWHSSLGMSSVRCPRAHCCWHLASVAVSSKTRWLRAGWHMALHTCGSQELEDRARHPLSRSVPSSLCLLLLWHQHVPRCIGVTDHSLCSLTPSVSSALFLADRVGQKRGPEGWDHQSSGRALGVLCLQGEHGSLTETFLYCARGYQAAQDN